MSAPEQPGTFVKVKLRDDGEAWLPARTALRLALIGQADIVRDIPMKWTEDRDHDEWKVIFNEVWSLEAKLPGNRYYLMRDELNDEERKVKEFAWNVLEERHNAPIPVIELVAEMKKNPEFEKVRDPERRLRSIRAAGYLKREFDSFGNLLYSVPEQALKRPEPR